MRAQRAVLFSDTQLDAYEGIYFFGNTIGLFHEANVFTIHDLVLRSQFALGRIEGYQQPNHDQVLSFYRAFGLKYEMTEFEIKQLNKRMLARPC